MKAALAFAIPLSLSACSAKEEQTKDAKAGNDPVEVEAQSLEKAADASVKIVEKDAQEQIDAAKTKNQAVGVMPEQITPEK